MAQGANASAMRRRLRGREAARRREEVGQLDGIGARGAEAAASAGALLGLSARVVHHVHRGRTPDRTASRPPAAPGRVADLSLDAPSSGDYSWGSSFLGLKLRLGAHDDTVLGPVRSSLLE